MTVYYCDYCGKKIYPGDSTYGKIEIKDDLEFGRKMHLDICGKCEDRFWEYMVKMRRGEV